MESWLQGLIGGAIIGVSASFMLLFNGRVAGISGIFFGALRRQEKETAWRWLFLLGLFLGGLAMVIFVPRLFARPAYANVLQVILAGLLVGIGTRLGNGCTSGHGVCGISRLSMRSILATVTFILAGVITVAIFKI